MQDIILVLCSVSLKDILSFFYQNKALYLEVIDNNSFKIKLTNSEYYDISEYDEGVLLMEKFVCIIAKNTIF